MSDDKDEKAANVANLFLDEKMKLFHEFVGEFTVKATCDALENVFKNQKSRLATRFLNMSEEDKLAYTMELIQQGAITPAKVKINEDALEKALLQAKKEVEEMRDEQIPLEQHKPTVTPFKKSK